MKQFLPILSWLPNYKKADLSGDVFAGITVGIMLIPQGMAYALIAGLPPVYGLYASVVPQIIYAIFGTSRQLSVAPVAMDSLLVATGVSVMATEGSEAYVTYAIMLAFFMGVAQFLLGAIRMGFITNLLAKPVISGFTSAAALIIGLNQLKYLLGVNLEKSNQVHRIIIDAFGKVGDTHIVTLLLGVAGIVLIKGIKKVNPKIPGALVAVVAGILVVLVFGLHNTGVSIVREVPEGLPAMMLPDLSMETIEKLLPLSLTIAVVAFMEAFSVAKAIEAKRRDYKVNPNQELIALGAANIVGSLFQSYPVTGGFSRSAVNNQAGANTPLASIISAVLVALTLLFLTPLFYHLPHAILAAIIMVAVSGLVDLTYAKTLWKTNKIEFALLLATFLITLQFSMVPGIVSGIILSILILLFKAANPHMAILGRVQGVGEFRNVKRFKDLELWEEVFVIRVDAPFAFVNIQTIKDRILNEALSKKGLKFVVIDAGSVAYIDATAVAGLRDLMESLEQKQIKVLFAEVIGPVRDAFYRNNLVPENSEEFFFLTTDNAVNFAVSGQNKPENKAIALQRNA
ncbi:SulP family inorganic anion transporter [Roseivirga pacifica]|uniref:SulP family inorganic anion transporter n=1 Tax=Roseivirga pacifica TaxID=1267423 RepID=UPI002094DBFF|nr:sulfate permease [Roseivirga pacifica]MCO6358072.1 sulfate permease [Roseivirga pacifica]MCO6366510.1 sulfate permease [Roseivirga pacifica]MCO6370995.1 sulfate permease [Roseivirga pacifica]MCO6373803.1 sulfate permease [Roseivirga pacifica]MCO6380784.1 sulfate permease [Roseivirga pacifica]